MNKAGKHLLRFIGGHHDGLTLAVEDGQRHVVLPIETSPAVSIVHDGDRIPESQIEFQTYQRQTLRGNSQCFDVMAPPFMTGDELIGRLIHGYRNIT